MQLIRFELISLTEKIILIHSQLERRDVVASQTLRAALTKAEQSHPGLSYDIVMGILKKGDLNVNLNESILRLQGGASETDCKCMNCQFSIPRYSVVCND